LTYLSVRPIPSHPCVLADKLKKLYFHQNVQSVSTAIINCLTALSVINNGVREILPFVRYIGQYIDFEFDSIKKQNKGKGVVCAATWYARLSGLWV
jgi:hypothetical protein